MQAISSSATAALCKRRHDCCPPSVASRRSHPKSTALKDVKMDIFQVKSGFGLGT